jgi:hypothetical protein
MPCPKLGADNLCTIYKERYEENKPYGFKKIVPRNNKLLVVEVTCGKIEDILKTNELPDSVKKQCCFYNPKLLEIHHEN